MSYPNGKSKSGYANPLFVAADFLQGERISAEQTEAGSYREQNRCPALPCEMEVAAEGSWLQRTAARRK